MAYIGSRIPKSPSGAGGYLPDPRLRFVERRVFGLGTTGVTDLHEPEL